ncbi:MAG TPA: PLP-dependent transferase [Opitutaceae bacterium]|nr:PLP-dependent transferase [Opitutaceae bacterium]
MASFSHLPLGWRIPDRVHAVSCSLPTMRAVRGYEEKDPATVRQMASGYPRFVVHPLVRQLAVHLAAQHGLGGHTLWLASSARLADELLAYLGAAYAVRFAADGVHGVAHPESPELAGRAKTFLQNTGGFLASREAEDRLVRLGALPTVAPEELFAGDARAEVQRVLRRAFPAAGTEDCFLCSCGINAVYSAFRSVAELQAARGRTIWVQLGWLYLDTIAILKKFTPAPSDYVHLHDVFDRAALERLFEEKGDRIAGVITEVPTNPLIQTPDVPWLAALARRHDARVILDPSIASPFSVDLLPFADVVVASLTKYTANEGDVIAGLAVVNPAAPDAVLLRRLLGARIEPIYPRELARLAAQIGRTEEVLARIQANVPRVVSFLESRPEVRMVRWARHAAARENFERVARTPDAVGSMVTFELTGPVDAFYDAVRLPKGPSFGMSTTLLCPFIQLAHHDLVTSEAGRAELAASGLNPELMRLSVGTEPVEEIIAALAEALGACPTCP